MLREDGGRSDISSAYESIVYLMAFQKVSKSSQSLVSDGLYEFYIFNLYVEQILLDDEQIDARLGLFRTLVTPPLPRPLFCINGESAGDVLGGSSRIKLQLVGFPETLSEERMFLVYLGDIPEDVALVAVSLNGREFSLREIMTDFTLAADVHTNNTHGYTLKVPFDHSVVIQQVKH